MKRILVLGGGGFIGSAICDELLKHGYALRVFERPRIKAYREFSAYETVEWVNGDLQNPENIELALNGVDAVFHLVSSTLPRGSNDATIFDVQSNLIATLQLLETMAKVNVKRLVYISSGGTVYGQPDYLPIDEKHPTNPKVSYGITKLAIEKYLHLYEDTRGIHSTILRVTNPYGPRQRVESAQGAVGVFIYRALSNLPIEIWGDGAVIRDYIYVEDVARAFRLALEYDGNERVFNVGSGHGLSLLEVLSAIESALNRSVARVHLSPRNFDIRASVLSNQLLENETGWIIQTPFKQGVEHTIAWFLSQQEH